ncbi:MAG: hypothetical protein HYV17_05385 [Xanthomonadales bacterium]|nr:hypothetical protein [Xanthomonadales bacterium]
MSTSIPPFLLLTALSDASPFADLFHRKFRHPLPATGDHFVAFHRDEAGALWPLSYLNFNRFGDIRLVGGGCTDGEVIRRMPEANRDAVSTSGGVLVHLLRAGFCRFGDDCDAFFGHCGDARAYAVDIAAGFEPAGHEFLLVHWHKPLHEVVRRALVAKAHAIGPF